MTRKALARRIAEVPFIVFRRGGGASKTSGSKKRLTVFRHS